MPPEPSERVLKHTPDKLSSVLIKKQLSLGGVPLSEMTLAEYICKQL